jgi:hypothetical protein
MRIKRETKNLIRYFNKQDMDPASDNTARDQAIVRFLSMDFIFEPTSQGICSTVS